MNGRIFVTEWFLPHGAQVRPVARGQRQKVGHRFGGVRAKEAKDNATSVLAVDFDGKVDAIGDFRECTAKA